MPFRRPWDSYLIKSQNKTSVPRIKRKEERGSLCRKPCSRLKRLYELPLMKIEKEGEVMQIRIQLIQVGWNPSLNKITRIKIHSILSKVFSMSILMAIRPPLPLLELMV
jgi:hypothetical protein